MVEFFIFFSVIFMGAIIWWILACGLKSSVAERTLFIEVYQFPLSIKESVINKYPHLTTEQADHVLLCLREYFQLCNMAQNSTVSMPSQVVDVAWHEFILFTKKYESFCHKAFGKFLHHTPAEAMQSPTMAQEGIKTAWRLSCRREHLGTGYVRQLPLLFAIDAELNIADGFKYVQDCSSIGGDNFCASHIGCSSDTGSSGGDSSGDSFGDAASNSAGCSSCSSGD